MSAPKIIIFLPNALAKEKIQLLSNPIPYPKYFHLSISAFSSNLSTQNKEFVMLSNDPTNLFHKQCKYLLFFHE